MRFEPLAIDGAYRVLLDVHRDDRGAFARTFCGDAFAAIGVDFVAAQCNISRNPTAGTLRGMHFQPPPFAEAKLVQCVHGAMFDAIVDLRRTSPSFGQAAWIELSEASDTLLYIPAGCAHGFVTLQADTHVFYYIGTRFVPGKAAGLRWDDPALAIPWPLAPTLMSERDATYPCLADLPPELLA